MKRKKLLIFGAGVLCLTGVWRAGVYAQTLGDVGAATAAGTTLGAAGGSLSSPSKYASKATDAAAGAQQAAGAEAGGDAAAGGAATTTTTTTTTAAAGPSKPSKPLNWGRSGDQMVNELMSSGGSGRAANRAGQRTRRAAQRMGSKYIKPPVGYLAWYLKEDRYKVTSKVWQFVTTPNDRFYYRPWAPAMRLRSPGRVIGFHTWQDAMIAGYRPDPKTKPEPGLQLSYLANLTRGPMLTTYFEYVYAGQITPETFDANFRYVQYVVNEVGSRRHTRNLVGETVEKVLGAAIGQGSAPTSVGGDSSSQMTTPDESFDEVEPMPINSQNTSSTGDMPSGGADTREEDYNKFGSRAGALSRNPGQ